MDITGLDELVFGVDDVAACTQFLDDYGLAPVQAGPQRARLEALDGTAVVLAHQDDRTLPPPVNAACLLRKTVFGVRDAAALHAVARELARDREVRELPGGAIEAVDDSGFALGFQVSVRRPVAMGAERVNGPGTAQRPANVTGVDTTRGTIRAWTLSHIALFVPDARKAEAFYTQRLGFRVTDRFTGVGPFLQPAGMQDHHTHFLIDAPAHAQGLEHFTFHFTGPTDVLTNGARMIAKGYEPFWGPGRHVFGSNWFWYFNSPLACHAELDADMDRHDANWVPREATLSADASQAFLFQYRNKWAPGAATPANGHYA